MKVSFFLQDASPLARLCRLDPDRDAEEFQTGERAWVLQTYLRLQRAGCPVELVADVPQDGIVVFTAKQKRALQRLARRGKDRLLVGIREDVGSALAADCEVLQNGFLADSNTRFHIPLWPQPGMIRRDPRRANDVKRIVYKGFLGNLHADFRDPQWERALADRGLSWHCDAQEYAGPQRTAALTRWHDFQDVDLIVAVRPDLRTLYPRKPATKLYNAWLAGVPALLGPELAYRELRQSDVDYQEVRGVADALCAVDRLRTDPQWYAAMRDNGLLRAREFSVDAILTQWIRLLFDEAPKLLHTPSVEFWRAKPLWLKVAARRIARF